VDEWARLEQDRERLARISTTEWVAGILRDRIMDGTFPPETKLSEKAITDRLRVSRNPVREAFRLLAHENLLVYELNRGVSVRRPDIDDLSDLYRVRRLIECAAVREVTELPKAAGEQLRAAVEDAESAAAEQRWPDVGTANLRFHREIVGLISSPRIDQLMVRVWAELRLVWHVMANPREIYEPYVSGNRRILELLLAGDFAAAEKELEAYLTDAEQRLVAAYAAQG
jgi:DNA-binding GntR family transcriptional regulator